MANVGQPLQKSLLDWSLGGASPSAPAGRFIGLSLTAPTSIAYNEVGVGSGYARSSMAFGAAATVTSSATATNGSALTFGPFSTAAVISGIFVADSVSNNAGTNIFYGNLAAPRSPIAGDSLVLGSAALVVTMA